MLELADLESRCNDLKKGLKKNSQNRNIYNVTITDLHRAEVLLGRAIARIMNNKLIEVNKNEK